jgi:hypothetical protein
MNLHHPLCRYSSARVQIVDVLRNEQKFIHTLRQFGNCFMRGVRSRITNALPALAVPVPN